MFSTPFPAEYRTVTGVAGPLVVLDKVKVRLLAEGRCPLHTPLTLRASFSFFS